MIRGEFSQIVVLVKARDWAELLWKPTENGLIQIGRYGLVGGGAFIVDFGAYFLLETVGFHYLTAGVISFVIGFAFNFTFSRWLIFRAIAAPKVKAGELLSVLGISLIGLLLTEGLLFIGIDLLRLDFRVAKIIASVLVLFWNYITRKIFVYKV